MNKFPPQHKRKYSNAENVGMFFLSLSFFCSFGFISLLLFYRGFSFCFGGVRKKNWQPNTEQFSLTAHAHTIRTHVMQALTIYIN